MTSSSPTPAGQGPGAYVTASILLMATMTIMANATISPSLPGLKAHFADAPHIDTLSGLILTLPSLSVILTAGLFGWLADRYDRRLLIAIAAAFYGLGGASGLVADSLYQLLGGRVILGVGVAGTLTLSMVFGTDLFHGAARARYLGQQAAAMSVGGIVVMVLGGVAAALHWRGAFAIYLLVIPIAVNALVALWPHGRRPTNTQLHPTVPGEPETGRFPWRDFAFVGTLAFLFMATFYVMPTRLPFRLAELGVTNSMTVGLVMAAMMTAALPGALFYGRIRRYWSAMTVFTLSFAVMGAGLLAISQVTSLAGVVAGVVLTGAGMGPSMANYTTYFMEKVPASLRGRAAGMLTTTFFFGQFASPLVSAPLVAQIGLRQSFLVLGLAMAVVAMVLLLTGNRGSARRLAEA